ncbi:MAG: NAD(+) diphosphatase [Dehalococcoidia bacterium]
MYPAHIFAGNPLDRCDQERRDPAWYTERLQRADSRFLPLWRLNVLVTKNSPPVLGWCGPEIMDKLGGCPTPILLGKRDDTAYFAVDVSSIEEPAKAFALGENWGFEEARGIAPLLTGAESGIIAQTRAQIDWHARHRFCGVCGQPTDVGRCGLMRKCNACGAEHFPRTDPVAIMLVSSGDKCLLGQTRARMSSGFYSCLAGFIDQGESIEEAVRREVREEAGIEVADIRYHSSQPWPFPSSLMIGCHATAASQDIHRDEEEMSDVQWFTRDEVKAALRNENPKLKVPASIAIAHHLIRAWAYGEV